MTQDPLEAFNLLLRDDFSYNSNENLKKDGADLRGIPITSTGKIVGTNFGRLEKVSFE